jgi:hypothetical protein
MQSSCKATLLLTVGMAQIPQLFGQPGQSGSRPSPPISPSAPIAIMNRALAQGKRTPRIAPATVPGFKLAEERLLTRSTCTSTVAGKYSGNLSELKSRIRDEIGYVTFDPEPITSEQNGGGVQTIWAISFNGPPPYPGMPRMRIGLFPAFFTPGAVLTKLILGGAQRINLLSDYERILGLRKGALTEDVWQALVILHEFEHLHGTAVPDAQCASVQASMWNTWTAANACFSELIDPDNTAVLDGFSGQPPPACAGCHKEKNLVPAHQTATKKMAAAAGQQTTEGNKKKM